MTKKKDDGAKHSNEQLAAMTKAIRDANAEVQESREREAALSKQVSTLESQADTLKGRLSAESDIAQRVSVFHPPNAFVLFEVLFEVRLIEIFSRFHRS